MDSNHINKEFENLWHKSHPKKAIEEKEAAWEKFNQEVFKEKKVQKTPYYKYAIAASLLILIGVTGLLPYLSNETSTSTPLLAETNIIKNPTTSLKLVYLPDSSQIELAAQAEISYAKDFKQNRKVHLKGEAFFNVTKDKAHPFQVDYKQTTTTVLGTSFRISSPIKNKTQVDLYEGSIQMNVEGSAKNWLIAPGESFIAEDDQVKIIAFNLFKEFKNAPLHELINYIETNYQYKVEFQSDKINKNITLKIKKRESLDHVIQVLAQVYNLDYHIDHQQKRITFQS